MDTIGSSEHVAEVSKVSKFTLNEHKLYVLKHATQIVHDKELVGGAFEKIPTRQPSIPPYTVRTKLTETHDAYELMRRDTSGDTKVTRIGELLGGRCYLFNTFRLPGKTKNLYVLVDDLLEVLGFDINVDQFLQRYEQLYPIVATEEEKSFLQEAGLHMGKKDCAVYVTALSTFVLFGAAVVAAGCRVIDDYWEQLVKEQGFTMHHRVFPLSQFQLSLLSQLKPVPLLDEKVNTLEQKQVDWLQKWEAPYLTIQEQQSTEVRQEYGKEHARGEHTSTIVPGQSINCSLELSMNYDVPKYHYKNSFVNAQQNNVEDVPIGRHKQVETIPNGPVGRPSKRSDDDKDVISERDHSLNINGWKFDCLPLAPKGTNLGRTSRGLPYFEKERLLHRLRRLTPNQVRELEHAHDSLNLNTGLGKVRQVRRTKWLKYWQYKSGAPIGMTADQVEEFRTQYLSAILNYVEKETVYDEERNINIIHSTSRHPNSNFIGHSNVSGLKPPYIENPAYK